MKTYDVGIGWSNAVEQEFVKRIKKSLRKAGHSYHEITFINLRDAVADIEAEKVHYKFFIDRSSIDNSAYLHISSVLKGRGTRVLNDPDVLIHYLSKVHLHTLYTKARLPTVPITVLNPQRTSKAECKEVVKRVGVPFVLKPSFGGGGEGVKINARNENDIRDFFDENPADECIVQKYITPKVLLHRPAWFRPIFVCGEIIPLWWGPKNHFYQEFGKSAEEKTIATHLYKSVEHSARITGLSLFSAEIIVNEKGEYQFIDLANYPIDLNTQENVPDGLPESVLDKVVQSIVREIDQYM
jgi:glutathione synthase/RimK-type ligase-like ATP-grasp enzyme